MGHPSYQLNYRSEIDGLRAIAVLAVVFYHAGLGCPGGGGYDGIDVFFVISDFLITSLIRRDLHAGTFSLACFWERRIRRIFPALAVCVLMPLVAGYFMLLPNDLKALGKSAVAQALMVANLEAISGASRPRNLLVWGDNHAKVSIPVFETMAQETSLLGKKRSYTAHHD